MGCFLACFGSSKDERKRRKQGRNKGQVQPREQRPASHMHVEEIVTSKENLEQPPVSVVSEAREESEEKLSLTSKKKVTFDTNVTTYEHIPVDESTEFLPGIVEEEEKGKEAALVEKSESRLSLEEDTSTSSTRSYPSGHRYQNCRESDDEEEDLDFEEGDDVSDEYDDLIDDYDDDADVDEGQDSNDFCEEDDIGYMERRVKNSAARVTSEEVVDGPMSIGFVSEEIKNTEPKQNARDRSRYVHPVLNPVENLTQWKAVKKSRGTEQLKAQKENFSMDEESRVSFSLEPTFEKSSFNSRQKSDQPKKSNQDIPVDASLSNWLVTPETTPNNKTSKTSTDKVTSEMSPANGSSSIKKSLEDRPILGALTVEELRQMSVASSPRKSPSRSPDEMPIIGTVGTYWNHTSSAKGTGSVSSFKGIPNTTSKYSEDKKVNWHSTPFETRLERALKRGAAEA